MTTLIFGIASIGINGIHANVFDIDQNDKKYEKIKNTVKKIIAYKMLMFFSCYYTYILSS